MNLVLAPQPSFLFTAAFTRRTRDQFDRYTFDAQQTYRDYVLCAFVARSDSTSADLGHLSRSELQSFVGAAIRDWHPDIRRMIREADEASAATFVMRASEPVPAWPTRPVTLVGDALHSMPPVGGLGANAALRDARLLRDVLADVERGRRELIDALAAYESESRRHGFEAVDAALRTQRRGLTSNRAAVGAIRHWFRLTRRSSILRKLTFSSEWSRPASPRAWESPR